MLKIGLMKYAILLQLCCAIAMPAGAFSASQYATTSKLAQGKWVKIAIPQSGVYELTYDQLSEMGFSSPLNVRVYGSGGYMLSETLSGNADDDLVKVPVSRYNNKICFYAKGPVAMSMTGSKTSTPHFTRVNNAYSTCGYYFLTEESGDEPTVASASQSGTTGTVKRATSLDYYLHEKELTSPSMSGKDLLGETLVGDSGTFAYHLPGLTPSTPIVVNTCLAATTTASSYARAFLLESNHTDTLSYTLSSAKIYAPSSSFVKYNSAAPYAAVTPQENSEDGHIKVDVYSPNGTVTSAYLDYFILTYQHNNDLANGSHGQLRMGINLATSNDLIVLNDNAGGNMVVWNVDNAAQPVRYDYSAVATTNAAGDTVTSYGFTPGKDYNYMQYIAFNPLDTLMQISGWQPVANQNLHGEATPDMVIVTNKAFIDQAKRIADMHYNEDGLQVLVVDQEQVYNEFSSGTPDAMAIRLMNKMFYDRDASKFKYLLMLGCGSFDNRGLSVDKPNRLITYETDCSNDENYSYVSDDFFGMLADDSGQNLSSDLLSIGVGRIPSATVAEAKADVDKLVNYVVNPDYGVWRNNASFWSDATDIDDGLHPFQTEGIVNLMKDDLATGMFLDKGYVSMFYRGTLLAEPSASLDNRMLSSVGAKKHIIEMLESGQYFATYVGHAGTTNFSRYARLWYLSDVSSNLYPHLPIMTTACCNVARYDSNTRGIAESMFHQQGGGAIAMLTSARDVYAYGNDALNQAFVKGMFTYSATGTMPRLGDAYKASKRSFGTTSDYNKMSFLLLGDPAMKINYPKPHFKITKVGGNDVTGDSTRVTITPLQSLTITAQVMNTDNSAVNTNFNGDAYATLYDSEEVYDTISSRVNRKTVQRVIYYPRTVLAQVKGRVVNGTFTATLTVPLIADDVTTSTDTDSTVTPRLGLIKVYAHQDNTTEMVNGDYAGVVIDNSDSTIVATDDVAPAINTMYFNDETSSAEGNMVTSNSTLYINATDDKAINISATSVGQTMTLILDNGTAYPSVKSYATVSDNGKQVDVAFPLNSIASGRHSLTYTVYDLAGNHASRTINFVVGQASQAAISIDETPAVDKATFNLESTTTQSPTMTLKVTDATGHLVWSKQVSSFPYTWDLKGTDGKRVAPGLYKCFGTYEAGNDYGGTAIHDLIVVGDYKRSK